MQNNLPTLPDPELTPARAVANLPQISGESLQHVGRYANAVVIACFEQIGGLAMMVDWAQQNRTDFYTKLLPKAMTRANQVDLSANITIDDAISRLSAEPLDAVYRDVEDAVFYDL